MERYTEMEGFPHRVTVSSVSSDSTLRSSTEMSSNHRTRLLQTASNLEVPILPVTSVSSSFVASEMSIPAYNGSTAGRYSAHLSEGPTSGYATDPARFATHLPPASAISAYDPRSYTYNPGGFPIHQRHELNLNYEHMSQPYIGQAHHASLRTDSETYNAALALVQSQNKIFTDDSGGQYYQLEGSTSDNANYEVIHTHLVDNSTQNVSIGSEGGHVEKVIYVSEKPHIDIQQSAEIVQSKLENLEETPESHIEVVIETVELADISNKSSELQDNTVVVSKTDNIEGQNQTQMNGSAVCKSSKGMIESELKEYVSAIPKQIVECQESLTSTITKVDKTYKDTASQIGGPELESRFGVLLEELKDIPSGKACYIKLKPIKPLDLEGLYNSIFFDIEVDNELQVSPIEKNCLTEKTSKYTFHISTRKDSETKITSKKNNSDKTPVSVKSPEKSNVVKDSKTAVKEEVSDEIMTRARRRKMAKPIKKTAQKKAKQVSSKKGENT